MIFPPVKSVRNLFQSVTGEESRGRRRKVDKEAEAKIEVMESVLERRNQALKGEYNEG